MRCYKLPPVIPRLHVVLGVMLVLCQFGACSFGSEVKRDLTRPSDVNAYVDEVTGFGELEAITKVFERVDINDDNTPFLHTQINGKKDVWRVEIKNVRLKLKSAPPGSKDKYVRKFQVFVDPNTGHLLKVTSTFDGNDPDMLPEPPAAVAETRMKNSDNEMYHGFPAEAPKITFLGALDVIVSRAPSPFVAKEIHAVYVMHSTTRWGSRPRPVWAITLRGIPPITLSVPAGWRKENQIPVWQRNHIRVVVDAKNGKMLFATSVPQPLPPEEKKNK